MANIRRIVAFLSASFFTGGLAVIPQNTCLAASFVIASIILGLVALFLYNTAKKNALAKVNQLSQYAQQGILLTQNIPNSIDEYGTWKTEYANWHKDVTSYLNRAYSSDAIAFIMPKDRPMMHYNGIGGDNYQGEINTLRTRLDYLRELLTRYSSKID
jgi:hypothetical protein